MKRLSLIAATLAAFLMPSAATAKSTLKDQYSAHYHATAHELGKRAPGRNIRRYGIRYRWASQDGARRHWAARPATTHDYAVAIRQLRRLRQPPGYGLVRMAVAPSQRPAGVMSPGVVVPGVLQHIAACESGGSPTAVDPSGTYRGKYQFDSSTWASVGGSGDPAAAPEAEQDRRAAILYARSGPTPWPRCGFR